MLKCEVCCIGGGIAGLTSVHDLCKSFVLNKNSTKNKKEIILIESSSCLGGRISSKKWNVINTQNINKTKEIIIDVGAAYLHGIENTNSQFIEFLHNECGINFNQNTHTVSVEKIPSQFIHPLIKQNCTFKIIPIYYQKYDKLYDLNQYDKLPSFITKVDQLFEEYINNIECHENHENKEQKSNTNIIETASGRTYLLDKLPNDNITFLEWLKSNEINIDKEQDLMNYAQLCYGTEECIDIKDLGLRQFLKSYFEWNLGGGIVHLNGQYFKLIQYFENKFKNEYKDIVKIMLDSTVNKIKYNKDNCMVYINNGTVIKCKYCICTVPIPVLQGNKIIFEPKLSIQKQNCLSKLYAANGGKIYLQFNKRFWNNDMPVIYAADSEFASEFIFLTYPKTDKNDNDDCDVYIVCCISFAKESEIFNKYSENEIVENITKLLFKIFKINNEKYKTDIKCIKSFIWNWGNVKNINCAYSSRVVNSEQCKEILCQPIDNKLFLCGEAFVKSFPAVQNVMQSAKNVSNQIKYLSSDLEHIYF
eukprot:386254_1